MTPSDSRRRRTLADEVCDRLRWMIVTHALAPGAALNERELCARFGVSRTPVREATLRLAEHGLVTIAPQHGTFVAGIDPARVRQAQFLRENLEVPVVRRLCAQRRVDLAEPEAALLEQQVVEARGDFAAFVPLDDCFHRALFGLAGMGQLWSVIHAQKAHLDRIRFLHAPEPGKLPTLVRQHAEILRAIGAGDAAAAEAAVRDHVTGALGYMETLLAERPELFAAPPPGDPRRMVAAGG